jgi:hypothetical protein
MKLLFLNFAKIFFNCIAKSYLFKKHNLWYMNDELDDVGLVPASEVSKVGGELPIVVDAREICTMYSTCTVLFRC